MQITTDLTFESNIVNGLNIIDFYTDYCEPCKELTPILEDLSKSYKAINFLKVNATESRILSRRFKVMSAPTLIFYKNNEVINVIHGFKTKEDLKNIINQYI